MFDDPILALIAKHRTAGVVVDTNLLLVYFVGLCDRRLIETFKRTQAYRLHDFLLLADFLSNFARLITTPGILTEVNSLANQLQDKNKPRFYQLFKDRIALLDERHNPSRDVCQHRYFEKCGLSDAAILTIAEAGLLVLTDDLKLINFLQSRGIDGINFNHIRSGSF